MLPWIFPAIGSFRDGAIASKITDERAGRSKPLPEYARPSSSGSPEDGTMTWKRLGWTAAVGLAHVLGAANARAEETIWRPSAAASTGSPAVAVSASAVILGRPVPLAELG